MSGINPKAQDHEPTRILMYTASGVQLPVLTCRTVRLTANRAGLGISDQRNEYTVLETPELWQGPECAMLTHALRLMQVVTKTKNGSDDENIPDMKQLRQGFRPRQLLIGTGLSEEIADRLIRTLKQMNLLMVRQVGAKSRYYVHVTFRGVGPQLQKLTKADLVNEWVLPETRVEQKGEVIRMPAKKLLVDRHVFLTAALRHLQNTGSSEPNALEWFEVTLKPSAKSYLAPLLRVTEAQANRFVDDLKVLGYLKFKNLGPKPPMISVRADIEEVTKGDIARIRALRRGGTQPAPEPADADDASETAETPATPEQIQQILERSAAEIADLEAKVERLERELEDEKTAHAATRERQKDTVYIIPKRLAELVD